MQNDEKSIDSRLNLVEFKDKNNRYGYSLVNSALFINLD